MVCGKEFYGTAEYICVKFGDGDAERLVPVVKCGKQSHGDTHSRNCAVRCYVFIPANWVLYSLA